MIRSLQLGALLLAGSLTLPAVTITVLYGDNDGFGTGATTYKDPLVDNASGGEAARTDVRLIGNTPIFDGNGAFSPTSTLTFAPPGTISSITLTLRLAGFGGTSDPVDGPNSIILDGVAVPISFLNSFTSFADDVVSPNIETRSVALPASFFALFADGAVNLTGTRISENSGFGSFQVDYMQFDITSEVPEPSTTALLAGAGALLLLTRRLRR